MVAEDFQDGNKKEMKLSDRAEEILETLWLETVERGHRPDLAVLRDDAAFDQLQNSGFVSPEEDHLLTEKGRNEGRLCVRRHRLAERLLVDVLNVKAELVHQTGCKLEHALHKGLEDNICTLLGHPAICPHGRPIPRGRCCLDKKTRPQSLVVPMSQLRQGQSGRIAYLHTHNRSKLRKIMAMGALPGLTVKLVQRFPSFVFQIGQSQFAIDRDLADQIYLWLAR